MPMRNADPTAMSRRRFLALMGGLSAALFALFMLSFVLGRFDVPLAQVGKILLSLPVDWLSRLRKTLVWLIPMLCCWPMQLLMPS